MAYFRADKRNFVPNDQITTAQEYYDNFSEAEKVVEDALEQYRPPDKAKRATCLFVFEDEMCAKKHWSKMIGGKLYRVAIDKRQILHRGDMALMDEMKALSEKGQDLRDLAVKYWCGHLSATPEIELLVSSATVIGVVSKSEEERRKYLKERWTGKRK
jgi:hypothetical protein